MLLQILWTILIDNSELSDEKISELLDVFVDTLPAVLRFRLQAA